MNRIYAQINAGTVQKLKLKKGDEILMSRDVRVGSGETLVVEYVPETTTATPAPVPVPAEKSAAARHLPQIAPFFTGFAVSGKF